LPPVFYLLDAHRYAQASGEPAARPPALPGAKKFPGNSAEAVIISHKGGFSMAKDKGPKKEVKKPKKKK
jgi:hypothetical protein